jgi:chemotaxis protein MotB
MPGIAGDRAVSITDKTNAEQSSEALKPGSYVDKQKHDNVVDENNELKAELEELNTGLAENERYQLTDQEKMLLQLEDIRRGKLEQFKKVIEEVIEGSNLWGDVSIVEGQDKLVLRLNSEILFDSASADIKSNGRAVLAELRTSFSMLDHRIEVQGHTDSRPINTTKFPSNWELSNQRATNVVRFLQDQCGVAPTRLRSTGFGEYQPIGDNSTPEGQQTNRRIDIVITE